MGGWCRQLTLNRAGILPNSFLGGGTMTPESLRANLQVPKTQFTGADATLLNTVMEVALPGFLLMDYANDLRPEARLTSGGAGTIFRATLLDAQAIQRNGNEVVALKEVADWPTLSDEDNMERFHQEVSIMWSLSFHANIIKLIGYTEEPRCIITRLYPTDLFRYLHTQEDKSPLESHLLLHMCSGMVAALASVHSMGIAHRDIKSPNYLMQEPRPGSPFPDPIMCDFGLSRTSDDSNKAFESIKGMSPRYAPPEVFARVHLRNASNTVEDDKMSDIYSLGVVLWETTARQVRRSWTSTLRRVIRALTMVG
jgi:eukaryotic-like serine/threonine-protein kinase